MAVTNQSHPFHDIFIEPFHQGFDNIGACFSGRKVEQISQQTIALSLFQRVGACVIGMILLIPLINAVVFAILQAIDSSFVFQRLNLPVPHPAAPVYPYPHPGVVPAVPRAGQPPGPDELNLQRRNNGLALMPDAPVPQERLATAEEYQRRKNQAIDRLPHYPARNYPGFERSREIVQYDLDVVLERFNANHNPGRLTELFEYSGFDARKREDLTEFLRIYNRYNLDDQQRMVKVLLSKLFDFFQMNRPLFPAGTEQEALFKAEIRNVFNQIIDAHRNCVDQVLVQMESIIANTIADFESIRGLGVLTLRDRILNRAAFILFKYRTYLIRQICTAEYPEEHHMADLERFVKQRLADMLGMRGGVFAVGAHYEHLVADRERIDNIVHIFLDGQASEAKVMEETQQNVIDDRKTLRRRESKYNPEQYLLDAVKTYHGIEKTLRNDIFIWLRQHFNIEAEDEVTTQFIRVLSADPDGLTVLDGGNLTHQATLFLLEELGIFNNNNVIADL